MLLTLTLSADIPDDVAAQLLAKAKSDPATAHITLAAIMVAPLGDSLAAAAAAPNDPELSIPHATPTLLTTPASAYQVTATITTEKN